MAGLLTLSRRLCIIVAVSALMFSFVYNSTAMSPAAYANQGLDKPMLIQVMEIMDKQYAPGAGLLRSQDDQHIFRYDVRASTYYVLGLLARNQPGDSQRALEMLPRILQQQYTGKGEAFGTWRRSPEEKTFDLNWRDFVGIGLILLISHYASSIPANLVRDIDAALKIATESVFKRGVGPGYTNIALMQVYLMYFAGIRYKQVQWAQAAEKMGEMIYTSHKKYGGFEEFNSPTYYGVDLLPLILWRQASSPNLRKWGQDMYTGLWTEIAQAYQPALKNVVGPFDRAYGCNMTEYLSMLGIWIWRAVGGRQAAPIPNLQNPAHALDLYMGIPAALFGDLPAGVEGLRTIKEGPQDHEITNGRTATRWLSPSLMIGAETVRDGTRLPQSYLGTVHWQQPQGIGCISLTSSVGRAEVYAEPYKMVVYVSEPSELTFTIGEVGTANLEPNRWSLPGLVVDVKANNVIPTLKAGSIITYKVTTSAEIELTFHVLASSAS